MVIYFRVPNLLNLQEFQDFLDIFGIQMLQVFLCLISPDDSDTSGPCLLLQVSLCFRPVEHLFAILENSTLRRDCDLLRQVSCN